MATIRDMCFFTARQRSCEEGNIFNRVCVVHSGERGSHATIIHDALDLTIQGPPWPQCPRHARHGTSLYRDPRPCPRHVQTCSL